MAWRKSEKIRALILSDFVEEIRKMGVGTKSRESWLIT